MLISPRLVVLLLIPGEESLITAPGPESDDDDWNKISMTSSNGGDGQSLSWHSEVVSRNQEEDDKSQER
jgi:hypothetical protein